MSETGDSDARVGDVPQPRRTDQPPLRVAVTGASGLIGSRLAAFLAGAGHSVIRLVRTRRAADSGEAYWNPGSGEIDSAALEGLDAVVHLAGESIAAGRWNTARKEAIRASRVDGTRLLCETLAALREPPGALVAASAIGYYGNRGDEPLDESSPPGTGFLAETCREWEAATEAAGEAGVRVVNLRIGVVLSAAGGALAKMLTPFRLGLGGVVGSGRQYVSWIALEDVVAAVHFALQAEELRGPVNAVAPQPVTNRELTKTLGRVLGRPTILPLPAALVRLAFGEMGRALLLDGARVQPRALLNSGFEFRYPALEGALRAELFFPTIQQRPV